MAWLRAHRWRIGYFALLTAVVAHFCLVYATRTTTYMDLDRYIAGTERLPFQYRALTAWIGGGIHWALGKIGMLGALPKPFDNGALTAFTILNFASLFIAILATAASVRLLTRDEKFARLAAFLVPLMGLYNYLLMVGNWPLAYPYDLPQLALFALCLLAMIAGRTIVFHALFVLAALNRETALFLVAIYALYHFGPLIQDALRGSDRSLSRRAGDLIRAALAQHGRIVACLLLQLAILVACRALVLSLYGGNQPDTLTVAAGSLSFANLSKNLSHLANPIYWPSLLSNFAFLWLPLIFGLRYVRHPGLRYTPLVAIPWLAAMMLVGVLVEMRVFGELVSLFAIVLAAMAHDLWTTGALAAARASPARDRG